MSERTKYQQQMDEERLSPQKADETLKLLLKENDRLNAESKAKAGRKTKSSAFLRYAPALAAVAAVVVIMLAFWKPGSTGTGQTGTDAVSYGQVQLASLPKPVAVKGGVKQSFEEAFGLSEADLFGSLKVEYESVGAEKQATLLLDHEGQELTAYVSGTEPGLSLLLGGVSAGFGDVKFNRDPDKGTLSAVFQKQGLWIRLDADGLEEAQFEQLVKELIG